MSSRSKRPPVQGQGSVINEAISCLHFSYQTVLLATRNFDARSSSEGGCKLGEGGFGPVFKGELHRTEVAIKVLRRTKPGDKGASELANEQFEAELQVLSRFRHPNLVTLLGYSNDAGKPRCLIYEFMPNGTLEDALELGVESRKTGLPWMVRISIALDTARGLSYLHTAMSKTPLVHRDVKSANVLLDLSFRAKVGDFGLARAIGQDPHTLIKQSHTARIVGTSGYIAPEYYRGVITTKLDTYAFGVLLLELLTGQSSFDQTRGQECADLVTYIDVQMKSSVEFNLFALIDDNAGNWPSGSFIRFFDISQKCLILKHIDRPEMSDIYILLDELAKTSYRLYAEQEKDSSKKETQTTDKRTLPTITKPSTK